MKLLYNLLAPREEHWVGSSIISVNLHAVTATSHGCKLHPKILQMLYCPWALSYALGWNCAVNFGEGRSVGRKNKNRRERHCKTQQQDRYTGDTQETCTYQRCVTKNCWLDILYETELQKIPLAALEVYMITATRKKKHPESESLSLKQTAN